MNKRVFLSFAVVLLLTAFYSCDKANQGSTLSKNQVPISKVAVSPPRDSTHYLFYAHWKSPGRAKKGCTGWGLCNFKFCFFCTVSSLKKTSNYVGTVTIDSTTNKGSLTIALDPSDSESLEAIQNKSDFFVDQDIINNEADDGDTDETVIIKAGDYTFNPNIGTYGGYQLNAEIQ